MSIFPTVRPSLLLDFQKSKQLDPRVSFSRSSSATYVEDSLVKTANEHQARFEADGLLLEGAKTNEVIYSEDFTQNIWGKYGVTITSNATTAPDGSTTADKFSSISGSPLLAIQQAKIGLTNGAKYSRSVFVKAAELTSATMQIGGTTEGTILCVVDLSNGTSTGGGVVTAYSNGWYKVERTFTMSGTTNDFYVRIPDNSAAGTGIYAWGVQLEEDYATSYIPTGASAAIRAADTCQLSSINFYPYINRNAFTIRFNSGPVEDNARLLGWGDGGTSLGQIAPTTPPWVNNYNQAGSQSINLTTARDTDGSLLQATAYAENDFAGQSRGRQKLGYGPSTTSGPCSVLNLGTNQGIKFCGFTSDGQNNTTKVHIKSLAIYPERLANTQLEALTL